MLKMKRIWCNVNLLFIRYAVEQRSSSCNSNKEKDKNNWNKTAALCCLSFESLSKYKETKQRGINGFQPECFVRQEWVVNIL